MNIDDVRELARRVEEGEEGSIHELIIEAGRAMLTEDRRAWRNFRILVTGSRNWHDPNKINVELGREIRKHKTWQSNPRSVSVITGGARGADQMAADVALRLGCRVETWVADWDLNGGGAGHIRNAQMVHMGANVTLAFLAPCVAGSCSTTTKHYSHGTSHCAEAAERAGIKVERFYQTAR